MAVDSYAEMMTTAVRHVVKERRDVYGDPKAFTKRVARLWNAYLINADRDSCIVASDIAPLMRLFKEARLQESPNHWDSYVDLIGYTLIGAEVSDAQPPSEGET